MHDPIRVTHLIVGLDTGGAERSLLRLVRHTQGEIEHRVICFGRQTAIGKDITALGVDVCYVDKHGYGLPGMWQAWRAIKADPPQVLQGWMYYGNLLVSLLALGLPDHISLAWNIRQSPSDFSHEKWSIRWAIKASRPRFMAPDLIVYNSYAGQHAHSRLGYHRHHNMVIRNGIDLDEFQPSLDARARVRQEHSIGDTAWVGMICRYHPLKGMAAYMAAVRRLLDTGVNARFFLAGRGMDAENSELAALLDASGLHPGDVDLLGEIPEPAAFLPALDLLVLASEREGTPNILLEAMACGVNTVATDVGDAARIVRDDARVVAPGDVAGLVETVSYALNQTDEADQRLADDRAFLAAHYQTDQCMAGYIEQYRYLVGAI